MYIYLGMYYEFKYEIKKNKTVICVYFYKWELWFSFTMFLH